MWWQYRADNFFNFSFFVCMSHISSNTFALSLSTSYKIVAHPAQWIRDECNYTIYALTVKSQFRENLKHKRSPNMVCVLGLVMFQKWTVQDSVYCALMYMFISCTVLDSVYCALMYMFISGTVLDSVYCAVMYVFISCTVLDSVYCALL